MNLPDMGLEEINTVKETLLLASRLVESGWCQGASNVGERYCAIGAMCAAGERIRRRYDPHDFYIAANAVDSLRNHLKLGNLVPWNDHPDRKKEEVVKALRDCAESI